MRQPCTYFILFAFLCFNNEKVNDIAWSPVDNTLIIVCADGKSYRVTPHKAEHNTLLRQQYPGVRPSPASLCANFYFS